MSCPHLQQYNYSPPSSTQTVYREECTQCFDSQDGPDGIDVCLACFNGGCTSSAEGRHHALTHANKRGAKHGIVVNVRRRKREQTKRDSSEPPLKKLAIREEEPEHVKYRWETYPKCYACAPEGRDLRGQAGVDKLDSVIEGVLSSMSSAQKSEVKAWEEEIESCSHARDLEQDAPSQHYEETGHPVAVKLGTIEPEGTADIYCYLCNDARLDPHLQKHLSNFGIDVSSQKKTEKSMTELNVEHNLKYDFSMTGEDGKELEPLAGPALTGLRNLGNSCYMASTLQSVFALGPFATRYLLPFSLHAETCPFDKPIDCVECQMGKMADGLLTGRYAIPRTLGPDEDANAPAFQEGIRPIMFKSLVGKGHPEFATMRQQDAGEFMKFLFKTLQQSNKRHGLEDATRIFRYVVEQKIKCTSCGGIRLRSDEDDVLTLQVPAVEKVATAEAMELESDDKGKAPIEGEHKAPEPKRAEFEPVELTSLLDSYVESRTLDEYKCPRCDKKVTATQTFRFATFPDVLVINAARFRITNWVPEKVDVPIVLPATLGLDAYQSTGKLDGEEELPDEKPEAPKLPEFNESAMAQLTGMGFPEIRCQKALLATGNTADAEAAMNWLFQHMEDPDIDDPINLAPAGASADSSAADEGMIAIICDMGFSPGQARQALRETGNNAERAVDWLFNHPEATGEEPTEPSAGPSAATAGGEQPGSTTLPASYKLKAFISHKGPSVHSGHYVAHVDEGEGIGWTLFNDEKVVKAEGGEQSADKLAPQAYLYIFVRS